MQRLITESNWTALPANTCHELVGRCEKLIYSRDWQDEVQEQLFKVDGGVDYTIAEFAFEMDIDIWERLFAYLAQHPLESGLFPYLLGFENDDRPKKVLDFIEKNINTYTQSETALLIPLKYLEAHPGTGIPIITGCPYFHLRLAPWRCFHHSGRMGTRAADTFSAGSAHYRPPPEPASADNNAYRRVTGKQAF